MRNLFLPAVTCTLWLMFTGNAAVADNITYDVDINLGAGSSVMGTITTNGMLGTIPNFGLPPNQFFQGYDLDVTIDGQSTTIMGTGLNNTGPFGQNLGLALTATDTDLIWNFNGSNSFLNFTPTLIGGGPACFVLRNSTSTLGTATCGGNIPTNALSLWEAVPPTLVSSPESGPFVFGEVPEPATVRLMLIGFGLVSVISLRKRLRAS